MDTPGVRDAELALHDAAPVCGIDVSAYRIPTDAPESDGTHEWSTTTMVLVEITAAGQTGIGFSYANVSSAHLIRDRLIEAVLGRDAHATGSCWLSMVRVVRNSGRPGIASAAISAVDNALWDLKGRLANLPLARLLGAVRYEVPVYGSGGFTSYDESRLVAQLGGWVAQGIGRVKMKVGRRPETDVERVRRARDAVGDAELFVDANGAYSVKQALAKAEAFAAHGVVWFEEPVSSDHLDALALLRSRGPAGMEITAGEYGYDQHYFLRMLRAGAVDVLQADATRCAGITGFLRAADLSDAFGVPLSAHTAPSMHVHACCAVPRLSNLEWFHDHVRIERMFFDGALEPQRGVLRPDLSRPGHGLALRRGDVEHFRIL
jgi:L-alanine-DL-glutamate epimerase-like enolase superfamily enzyme